MYNFHFRSFHCLLQNLKKVLVNYFWEHAKFQKIIDLFKYLGINKSSNVYTTHTEFNIALFFQFLKDTVYYCLG